MRLNEVKLAQAKTLCDSIESESNMRFVIPENMGSDLRLLPADTYSAEISDIFLGKSQSGQPKATVKYTITSEFTGKRGADFESTIGATTLETFSLQPQALFNINGLYKTANGTNIPQGDFDEEQFLQVLKDGLIGKQFNLQLGVGVSPSGNEKNDVLNRAAIATGSKRRK